jgi:hypothetical protein
MMFKILLAVSTAIIVGLILFSSGPGSDKVQPSTSLPNNRSSNQPGEARASGQSAGNILDEEDEKIDPKSEQQIRSKADEEYQAVQSQLQAILDSEPVHFSEARKLLQAQRRKVLLKKITLLGKDSVGDKLSRAAEDRLTLWLLDKELKLVSEQLDLLAKADSKE